MRKDDSFTGFSVIGQSIEKRDSLALACGIPAFTDDYTVPGMLYGHIVRSPHAHARIINIDASKALELDGIVGIYWHRDVPRIPFTTAGQGFPEPSPYDSFIFDTKCRFVGDRVAVILAQSHEKALEAEKLLKIEFDILDAVFSVDGPMDGLDPVIHDESEAYCPVSCGYEPKRNIVAQVEVIISDNESITESIPGGGSDADGSTVDTIEIDEVYHTPFTSHCAREPHSCISWIDHQGRIILRTSTQVPWHVRRIVAMALGLPIGRIRVQKPRIGGGFGGKQEVILEDLCAFLTLKTGRAVRLVLSREEVFLATRYRHETFTRMRLSSDASGRLLNMNMDMTLNTGAYGGHAFTVATNGGSKALALYPHSPGLRFAARAMYTNLPPAGAFRGYGAVQTNFALGVAIDELAAKSGMDPLQMIRRNIVSKGNSPRIFNHLGEGSEGCPISIDSVEIMKCLEIGSQMIGWNRKFRRRISQGRLTYGVGVVALMQGSGIPIYDSGNALIMLNDDGSFTLCCGATDIGTGSDTILGMIAAEVLTVPSDMVTVNSSDTDFTPFDVGAYASSTTFVSGNAVKVSALDILEKMRTRAALMLNCDINELRLEKGSFYSHVGEDARISFADIGRDSFYNGTGQIIGTGGFSSSTSPAPFMANFVEVAVDRAIGKIHVVDYVAVLDCGTPINPVLVEGQVEGGVLMGIGHAMTEECTFSASGALKNRDFESYKILGPVDTPPIRTVIVPCSDPHGPFGAKSVGEIGISGPMPAISNAIYDAVGIRLRRPPFTSERFLLAAR
ncbi:MAG: aldehyde oxidase [Candidatus Wallbacteria bacterium HGW-Wallbacteria-1]|jgi:probable selenate reductase molybdenum-binding subunit|uniref:Aldehyde oxidase n=1 Tax=Candidatus Wallbacteria bacterium HGW-Wallbacteria-1 TaxID=2013854 RepID=A0A2N1PRG5_9BACT|nr:MAG: aldehyde oxidase [Candidatus Wallbacteria bacterium HGW-Wallbacteria-1]